MVERASVRVAPARVLLVASAGAFLAFLDATIVNVAFPSIRESFDDASIGALSWVLNAYNIVFAAFLVICGRLTDLVGRRRAYVGGIALFTLASAWCAVAGSLEVLVAGRVVQALGAAMLVPASLALVVEAFPGPKRAHAIGLWGATAAVAAGLGPPLGGALVEFGDWRWAFWVNLPFGALAILGARRDIVESRAPGRRVLPDIRGALMLAAALASLNLALVKAADWGWGSARVIGAIALAGLLGAAFAWSSSRHRAPVVDPALVRIPTFGLANLATILCGVGFYAYLLTNILWLQYVWGYDVLDAGLALVPGAVVAAVVAARLGPLAERVGYRALVVPGAVVWAGAYVWYRQMVGTEPAFWAEWLPGQILSGIGVGATMPLLASAALAAVPGGRYAGASALVSSTRQLGGVLGIALLVVIIGTPSGPGVVDALRDGWTLSIVAFLGVALVAAPIGKVLARPDQEDAEPGTPLVLRPEGAAGPDIAPTRTAEIGLDSMPLLAGLPEEARASLADTARTVDVEARSWLFEEGDEAGSAYVLRSGRLEVVLGGQVVRELTPGAVVGELALLTGEPRSAGIRARRDSTLLELSRDAFHDLLDRDPVVSRALLTQVADQLRSARVAPTEGRATRPHVLAVVGLHGGSPALEVGEALTDRLRHHLSVAAPGRLEADGLARAEAEHECVVLVADGVDPDDRPGWRDFCVREADLVVLVAASDTPVGSVAHELPAQPELVLVGPTPAPPVREEWVASTDAWQLTLVHASVTVGVRALADRIAGRSVGLVLAGGGARAFAHIGVLRELEESGFFVDRVAGCSVGSIIAAMYATGMDGATVEDHCYAEFVRRNPFGDWTLPKHSLARGGRTRAGLQRTLGADTVLEGLPRQLHVVSVDLISRTRQVHRRGSAVDATMASVRLPVLFPPVPTDDGRLLTDGGLLDNLPVDLLTERAEGPVIAVNISMGGGGRRGPRQGRPRVPALGETLLRTMMIGSGGAIEAAHRQGAVVVTPDAQGVGLLEFHQFDRMVEAGREAARALLADGTLDLGVAGPSASDLAPDAGLVTSV